MLKPDRWQNARVGNKRPKRARSDKKRLKERGSEGKLLSEVLTSFHLLLCEGVSLSQVKSGHLPTTPQQTVMIPKEWWKSYVIP